LFIKGGTLSLIDILWKERAADVDITDLTGEEYSLLATRNEISPVTTSGTVSTIFFNQPTETENDFT